jgi:hypothetical protein
MKRKPLLAAANPSPDLTWSYWLPRIGHDVMSLWSVVFWIWAVGDAHRQAARWLVDRRAARRRNGA